MKERKRNSQKERERKKESALNNLRETIMRDARWAGCHHLSEDYLIIVDRQGDEMTRPYRNSRASPRKWHRYLNEDEIEKFERNFKEWINKKLIWITGVNLEEAIEHFSSNDDFSGKYVVLGSLEELVDWWSLPPNCELTAYNSYFSYEGFPAWHLSIWLDYP